MLDVHPPHERMHGFRDFLLHLLTITIGLLIALGLEGCVEWAHHRHLRNEADANLTQEIRDNRKEVMDARAAIVKERENFVNILKFLQARSQNQPYEMRQISVNFIVGTLRTASWRTASATGALGYMEYPHVQRYATAYQIQDDFSSLQTHTLDDIFQLQSHFVSGFEPEKLSPAEAQIAAAELRRTLAHLTALDQFGDALIKSYDQALAAE